MKKLYITIVLIFSLLLIIPKISKAECVLNFDNLSINNQTSNDKANIVRLQSILYINDLYDGPITGYYGALTEKAINFLKNSRGLKTDGIVDPETVNIICNDYYTCPFQNKLENGSEYPKKEIKFIQYFLRLLPNIYPERLVTGYYGTKTENAVKRLQKALDINITGKIDNTTGNKFCEFFDSFENDLVNTQTSSTTTSIFQTLCLAFPKEAKTGETVTFISQILGGNSPYTYVWNKQTKNNDKTLKASFSKPGTYTANLQVTDNKGNTANANCKTVIKGEALAQNNINLDNLQFETGNINDDIVVPDISNIQSNTSQKPSTVFDEKAFFAAMEKYINNPAKLDYEILPVEVVKGDPVKVNIINIPYDIKETLLDQWKLNSKSKTHRLKTYWAGDDLINWSLDRIVLHPEWYNSLFDGKVAVTKKAWSVFRSGLFSPKPLGWFDLPMEKQFFPAEKLGAWDYYMKGYNPKDDWSIYQKGLYVDYANKYYKNNHAIKKEIVNYFVFDFAGNYNIKFNLYYKSMADNKEYIIGYVDIPIKVIEKANPSNYVKAYITPGASKNSPQCIAGYTNEVPQWTGYPYRDLDGKFIGYNWQYVFVDDYDNGGGLWNDLNLTNIFAPIGDKNNLQSGQEGLFKDWERLFSVGNFGSTFYRAFQSDPSGMFFLNPRQPGLQDKYMCATWYNCQTKVSNTSRGISGTGFTSDNVYLNNPDHIAGAQDCRGICFQTTDLPDAKNAVVNKRNNNMYSDLIIKDYKMDNIDTKAGTFNIKFLVKNIGGLDFKIKDYTNNGVIITCNKGNAAGTSLNIFHTQSNQKKKVDFGAIINNDIKSGSEIWTTVKSSRDYCPAGETLVGCVIDPRDIVDETEEKNNILNGIRIDCDMPTTTTTTLKTTVTTKVTSVGTMYNLLTWPNQINYCSYDGDCIIKPNTVYCTHKNDNTILFGDMGRNYYFDKDCKCVGRRCQAVDKNN